MASCASAKRTLHTSRNQVGISSDVTVQQDDFSFLVFLGGGEMNLLFVVNLIHTSGGSVFILLHYMYLSTAQGRASAIPHY